MGLSALAWEVLFPKHVIENVNHIIIIPILLSDNQGAICVAYETAARLRAKCIDIKVHFARERIYSGKMTLRFVPNEVMIADFLKKCLPRVRVAQASFFLERPFDGVLKYSSVIGQFLHKVV